MLIEKLKKMKSRWEKGFTLVELLVAIAIMSILTIGVFAITNSASKTFAKGTESIVADDLKDLLLALMKQTLYTKEEIALEENVYRFGEGATISETLLSSHHLMFAYNGYIYYLPSNYEGEYEVDENGLPIGAQLLLEESAYGKYAVEVEFVPLYNMTAGRSVTLRVQLYVYERANRDNVVAVGKESFKLKNLERLGNSIEYLSESEDANIFFLCYYV